LYFCKRRATTALVQIRCKKGKKKQGKECSIGHSSPYRRYWSPFLGPSARECNGVNHPVLSYIFPVYLPQIYPGTHSELGRLRLSFQSHDTSPSLKQNDWVQWDSNPRPLGHPKSNAPIHLAIRYNTKKNSKMSKKKKHKGLNVLLRKNTCLYFHFVY